MKAIIVDDEQNARKTLELMINEYCENVEIVGSASSALEGIKLVNTLQPDLVFLDIEMPHGSGFDLLDGIDNKSVDVIFTTAYNHYAIKAIKFNAFDYLMKPINIDELVEAVDKLKNRNRESNNVRNEGLVEGIKNNKFDKISVFVDGTYHFVNFLSLIHI